jgi:hypothetical protein
MTTRNSKRSIGALLLSCAAILPNVASSQAAHPPVRGVIPPLEVSAAALSLHQKALQLEEQGVTTRWPRAARLHIRSARLRTAEDPGAEHCLVHAANLLQHTRPDEVFGLLIEAADRALARGDVLRAARWYLDAAGYVQERPRRDATDVEQAVQAVDKAKLLAGSPLLSEAERNALLARLR